MAGAGDQGRLRVEFDELFEANNRQLMAYALRRARSEADAEDVVVETMEVAWRRMAEVPSIPLPWLYGIARRLLANQRRGAARRSRLHLRFWSQPRESTDRLLMAGGPATETLGRLPEDDQELLRLLAWESLAHAGIGQVLGISPNAVGIRLHRAKRRFAREFELLSLGDVKGLPPSRTSDPVTGRTAGRDRREDAK